MNGLQGQYFPNTTFTPPVAITRIDQNIDAHYTEPATPDPSLPADWSTRWTGFIMPMFSETYTFLVYVDDTMAVWINGVNILPTQQGQGAGVLIPCAPIALVVGQPVPIRVDFAQTMGQFADAHLYWQSASQVQQIVPTSQLYSPGPAPRNLTVTIVY